MRARVILQDMASSSFEWVHGMHAKTKRLVVEEGGGLAITIFKDELIAFKGFKLNGEKSGKFEDLGFVEIPDELVDAALKYVAEKERFMALKEDFKIYLQ